IGRQFRRIGNARQARDRIAAELFDVALDRLFDLQPRRFLLVGIVPTEKHRLLLRLAPNRCRRAIVSEHKFHIKPLSSGSTSTFAPVCARPKRGRGLDSDGQTAYAVDNGGEKWG